MLQLDKTATMKPAQTTTEIRLSELHHTHGQDVVEVDIQDANGNQRRLKRTLTALEQSQLEAIHETTINAALGVTSTKAPDPTP